MAHWKSCFGGPGDGRGTFDTPHGLWLDSRPGREPRLVVADRAHHTLQMLTPDGQYQRHAGRLRAARQSRHARRLDGRTRNCSVASPCWTENDQVVAHLGDDSDRIRSDTKFAIRGDESQWQPGRFVHPHDACFDADGNIFVAEWVATGRVTNSAG